MKNTIYSLLTALIFAFSISAFADGPPPPNNGGNPIGGGNDPVGAPIDGGLFILLALGAGYGAKKVYNLRKEHLEE